MDILSYTLLVLLILATLQCNILLVFRIRAQVRVVRAEKRKETHTRMSSVAAIMTAGGPRG